MMIRVGIKGKLVLRRGKLVKVLMRVVQQLLIRMTLDLVKAQLMVQVKLLIA
jgi:hypothetical protein